MNPLEQAIRSAERMNEQLAILFGKLGTTDHPRGMILAAYRNARRGMRSALTERFPRSAALEVMRALQRDIRAALEEVLAEAQSAGAQEAEKQLALYKILITTEALRTPEYQDAFLAAVDAVMAKANAQISAVDAIVRTGADAEMILGTADRVGLLRPSDVISAAAFWAARLTWGGFSEVVERNNRRSRYQKQAIAALDLRTTDCCLQAHGQIQPFDGKFRLTGTPRFADEMDWAPFHWYCRTSIAIYDESYDDGLTERMRQGARQVMDERRAGQAVDRHPADAFA